MTQIFATDKHFDRNGAYLKYVTERLRARENTFILTLVQSENLCRFGQLVIFQSRSVLIGT